MSIEKIQKNPGMQAEVSKITEKIMWISLLTLAFAAFMNHESEKGAIQVEEPITVRGKTPTSTGEVLPMDWSSPL